MADEVWIDGDVDDLCAQIDSGKAAEGYARIQGGLLRRLCEMAETSGRVSYPLHTPQAPGEMASDAGMADPSQPFKVRLRAMLQREGLVEEEPPNAGT